MSVHFHLLYLSHVALPAWNKVLHSNKHFSILIWVYLLPQTHVVKFFWFIGTQNHALILDNKLRRSNGKAIVVTLDIRKAYDTVDRRILFRKLIHRHGFGESDMKIIYELMEYNEVEIVQEGIVKSKKLNLGLPQGCTLSPVLFNAFIDDICDYFGEEYRDNILLYADDIVIISEDEEIIRGMLRVIETHSNDNNYKLNPSKCYVMTNKQANFSIYDTEIIKTEKIKYLGFIYNLKGLDVSGNIEIIRTKIFGRAAMLRRFITSANILNPAHTNTSLILVNAYKVYCRPLIEYPLAIMSCFKYMRDGCEKLQRGILKYLFGINHRIPTKILYGLVPTETTTFRGLKLANNLRLRSEN